MLRRAFLAATALVLMATAGAARADGITFVNDLPILELIGGVEGPEGYHDYYRGISIRPSEPVDEMTIGEVVAFQRAAVRNGSRSSAVGRFQFIDDTLLKIVRQRRIHPDSIFDRNTQNYLARMELRDCGFYSDEKSDVEVGNCLARVWAALPVLTGPRAGRSYYHGIAGNRSLVSIRDVMDAVSRRFEAPEPSSVNALHTLLAAAEPTTPSEPLAEPVAEVAKGPAHAQVRSDDAGAIIISMR